MILLNILFFLILGSFVGSFLNVFVLRYNTSLSFVKGRSKCFSCGKKLNWYEMFPIVSFLALRGKCSECKSKISLQYPIVEAITTVLFSLIFIKFGFSILLPVYFLAGALLIAISAYDYLHKIIPDGMVFAFDFLALLSIFFTNNSQSFFQYPSWPQVLSGPILFSFFGFLWLVSKGRWMGFGDAKLALGVGWFLGLFGGIFSIMMAFWIGAIFSIILMLLGKLKLSHKKLTIKSEIPFAPFIIFTFFLEFFCSFGSQYFSYLF